MDLIHAYRSFVVTDSQLLLLLLRTAAGRALEPQWVEQLRKYKLRFHATQHQQVCQVDTSPEVHWPHTPYICLHFSNLEMYTWSIPRIYYPMSYNLYYWELQRQDCKAVPLEVGESLQLELLHML